MKRHGVSTIVGLGMLCLLTLSDATRAGTIHVPADKPTVQSAVDAAISGDVIEIAEGTYSGPGNRDIELGGKRLEVYGVGPQVIIDCGGSAEEHHGAFIFNANDTGGALVSLTITNAYFPVTGNDRGAITYFGGNYRLYSVNIKNNHSHGISILGPAAPVLSELEISSNLGWGLYMPGYPYLSVGVRIFSSQIDHNSLGGMILTRAVEKTYVENNTIADNGGDGLFLQGDLPLSSATSLWDTTTIIENNIFAFNADRGIYFMPFFTGVHYRNNLSYGNGGGDVFGLSPDTSCMISADPLFCRQQGGGSEYGLTAQSPCLSQNNPCGVPIGALPMECTSCCIGYRGNVDCDPGNGIDISDIVRLIDYEFISFDPPCCFDAANVDGEGNIDISDLTELIRYVYYTRAGAAVPTPHCPMQ